MAASANDEQLALRVGPLLEGFLRERLVGAAQAVHELHVSWGGNAQFPLLVTAQYIGPHGPATVKYLVDDWDEGSDTREPAAIAEGLATMVMIEILEQVATRETGA